MLKKFYFDFLAFFLKNFKLLLLNIIEKSHQQNELIREE